MSFFGRVVLPSSFVSGLANRRMLRDLALESRAGVECHEKGWECNDSSIEASQVSKQHKEVVSLSNVGVAKMRKMEMKFSSWKNWTVRFATGVCSASFPFQLNDLMAVQLLR